MLPNSKRILTSAIALMAMAVAPARSQSRNLSIDPVPADVIEDIDPNLIDFVIAGFPKCGTTYLQNKIFYESEKVFVPHKETHYLANDKYTEFKNEFANVSSSLLVG